MRAATPEDCIVPDAKDLVDLHEAALLHNLRERFFQDEIYTYVGPILVSVNPYKVQQLWL